MKLSILMPVYNEEERIADALKQALAVDYPCEIELVVVDDGSRDGTGEILGRRRRRRGCGCITHPRNAGKGAAIRTRGRSAEGDYMVILDADLEYDPQDIPRCSSRCSTGGPRWSTATARSAATAPTASGT